MCLLYDYRVNACILDYNKSAEMPDSATMWNDFDSVYYDGEVAVTNPVDIKFNMVRIINYNHKQMKEAGRRYYSVENKPTNEERMYLLRLLNTVLPEDLKDEDRTLIWTYR